MASITDGNYIVVNQGQNPLVNYNFMLRVELLYDLPCKSVRGFSRDLEYDYIQEGGLNDYVHMRRKPITQPFTLEVERYVGVDYTDPLPLGADLVLPLILIVSRVPNQFLPFVAARTYVFTGCTVMKKNYGDLVAAESGLLVETTTIGYREMLCVDIPWSEVGDNIFAPAPTPPTSAITDEKTAQQIKRRGQDYYERALVSKNQAEAEYSDKELNRIDAVTEGLTKAVEVLEKAVAEDGALTSRLKAAEAALETAKKGLKDENGKLYKDIAAEAKQARNEKEQVAKAAQEDYTENEAQYKKAKTQSEQCNEQIIKHKENIENLTSQIKANKEEREAILDRLAKDPPDIDSAEAELKKYAEPYEAAQREAEEADRQLRRARQELAECEENMKNSADEAKAQEEQSDKEEQNTLETESEADTEENEQLAEAREKFAEANEKLAEANEKLARAKEDYDPAEQKVNEARNAVKQREQDEKRLAGIDRENERLETQNIPYEKEQLAKAEEEYNELQATEKTAENAAKNSKSKLDAARTAADNARTACDKAEEKYMAAEKALVSPKKEAGEAQIDYNYAKKNINPLKNSITNLNARKEKVAEYKNNCIKNHDECKNHNDTLQSMKEDSLPALNAACEVVKKSSQQTTRCEVQLRNAVQYIRAAEDMLEDAQPVVDRVNADVAAYTKTTTDGTADTAGNNQN